MILSTQHFQAYDDRCKHHKATTFSYSSESERDMEALLLRKDKSVLFVKNLNAKRLTWTEFWTTAHYKKKEKFERVSGEYSI